MADLPHCDLSTDGAPELRRHRVGPSDSEVDKRLSEAESRIDSGLGFSYTSTDSGLSMDSLRRYVESNKSRDSYRMSSEAEDRLHSDSCNTSSLQNQLKNLSIGGSDKLSDTRCDSGRVESGIYSLDETSAGFICETALPEVHFSPESLIDDSVISTQELDELFSQDEDGDTHLHMSIIHLLTDISLRIVSFAPHPALLSLPNTLHQTPLHLATATRQRLVARRLMGAGVSLEAPDHAGNTPLHMACRDGMMDLVVTLLQPVSRQERLGMGFGPQYQQQFPATQVPQDLSLRNYEGCTCAHLALQNGHLSILQVLLARGANINEPDGKSGRTLLHMAADMGYVEALEVLLRYQDLNLNARTYGGLTAVSLAHGRRLGHMVERLIRAGAEADYSQLAEESGESTDEEMTDSVYDDICINGQPVCVS